MTESVEAKTAIQTSVAQAAWICAIALLSAVYYARYIDVGFNAADDGNYAQMAYELFLGRPVDELAFNYGLLWFQLGAWAFRLFGVDYTLIKIIFFGTIALTNILIFLTVARISDNRLFAAVVTSVPLLVPAFPATAFYGFCILINAAAQMRLAARGRPGNAALAGAVLALSFQIRPDFGYVFAVPLAVVIALAPRASTRALGISAATAFVAMVSPFLFAAATGGFLKALALQYLGYPVMMLQLFMHGVGGAGTAGGTVLQRPDIATAPLFAALVYLPLATIAGFVILNAALLHQRWRDGQRLLIAQSVVAVVAGIAAFPHYFLFRPDMAHVANFMPGFVVLAAAFATQLWRRDLAGKVSAALVLGHLGFYAWVGVQSGETGSIGIAKDRTERFQARNGVDVLVRADERDDLENLRQTIEENSRPGDAIICLPYCPGIAFMTGRRMLFRNFFVDDSFLTRTPQWLPEAIALTREKRPLVVIVRDWAINGTEISRFKNWAAPYMSVLDEIAVRKADRPGLTVYFL